MTKLILRRRSAGSLLLVFGLAVAALKTARIDLPADFEATAERISIAGFGGHNKGRFQFNEFSGEFTRGESRLSIKDSAYVSNKGKSSFTLRDAGTTEIISAACQMKKGTVTIGIVTFDPKKLSYQCDFTHGDNLLAARLIVGQPKAKGVKEKLLAKDLRRGESNTFDQHLLIESVHRYAGSRFQSQPPLGYLLQRGDQLVAAVELTDVNPTLIVAADLPDELRHSVMATALALSVLRDPANSALED
jgi:hypothetical protein